MFSEPSEAGFRRLLLGLAIAAGPLVLLFLFCRGVTGGGLGSDAMDYAQLGRNLSAGRGFTTEVLRPLQLGQDGQLVPQPELIQGPLYPFLLALAIAPFGARDAVVVGVSGLFYLLTLVAAYALGSRVFSRTVGLLAVLVLSGSLMFVSAGASGLPITLEAFLTTALLLTIYRLADFNATGGEAAARKVPKGLLFTAGSLAGALYLTDSAFFLVLLVAAVAVLWLAGPRRALAALWFLAPLAILVGPWMWRQGVLTGNPVFGLRGHELWMNTDLYPGQNGYRLMHDDLVLGQALLKAVVKKFLLAFGSLLDLLPQYTATWVLALFFPATFFAFRNPAAMALRRVIIGSFLALLVTTTIFFAPQRVSLTPTGLLVAIIPAMLVFALAFLVHLIQQAKLPRGSVALVATVLTVVIGYPLLSALVQRSGPNGSPVAEAARQLNRQSDPGEVALTDQPFAVAWYADRPALWIPASDERTRRLRQQDPALRWLFLTPGARGLSDVWGILYNNLATWNRMCFAAQTADPPRSAPPPPTIQPKPQAEPPPVLVRALTGFTAVAPAGLESASPVVLAVAPAAGTQPRSAARLPQPPARELAANRGTAVR